MLHMETQDTFSLLLFPTSLVGVNLVDGDHYCPLLEACEQGEPVCAIRPPIHDEDICHNVTLSPSRLIRHMALLTSMDSDSIKSHSMSSAVLGSVELIKYSQNIPKSTNPYPMSA